MQPKEHKLENSSRDGGNDSLKVHRAKWAGSQHKKKNEEVTHFIMTCLNNSTTVISSQVLEFFIPLALPFPQNF